MHKTPDQIRAECEAREARVDALFDDLMKEVDRVGGVMEESLRPRSPTMRTRATDRPQCNQLHDIDNRQGQA